MPGPTPPTVALIGGGIAGLTAALRLSQRGFAVTIFEAKAELGGNMSSQNVGGLEHDVYPHMFCDWYANFWQIFETDLGLSRETNFAPQDGIKILEPGADTYIDLKNPTTFGAIWDDLQSGILSVPEMIVLMFSMLDLASYPLQSSITDDLDKLDVNGFLYSRGYSTEQVAKMHNYILTLVWSVNSDMTAAKSYQDFLRHFAGFPNAQPLAWLLKGSLWQKIIRPLAEKLKSLGCTIETGARVISIDVAEAHPVLTIETAQGFGRTAKFDYAIIAVPAGAMIALVMGRPGDDPATKIVNALPQLAQMQHFRDSAIPVVDIYFKQILPNFPQGQIGLKGSSFMLSVVDIGQLWTTYSTLQERTVLVLAASDGFAIPATGSDQRGFAMIEELARRIPVFNPGKYWGDPESDIEWSMTYFRSNEEHRLFINDVGSWPFRPGAADPVTLPNVFLAGDYCRSGVDMATIEAAVQTGLLAAQALQAQDAKTMGMVRGDPITLCEEKVFDSATLLAAKLVLLPAAYGASAWSALQQIGQPRPFGLTERKGTENYPLLLPLSYALDWWKTAYSLALEIAPGVIATTAAAETQKRGDPVAAAIISGASAGAAALNAAADALQAYAARQPGRGETRPPSPLAAAFSNLVIEALLAAENAITARGPRPGPGFGSDEPYRRRWRVKP